MSPRKPKCAHLSSHVYNSRRLNGYIWRRRECKDCGDRWSTVEMKVDLQRGGHVSAMESLRAEMGLSVRQQKAIGEVIQAFLDPAEERQE